MKIAITATGRETSSNVDPRFGRARHFIVVDTDTNEAAAHDNTQNLNAAQGAGIQAGETVARLGAAAVVSGNALTYRIALWVIRLRDLYRPPEQGLIEAGVRAGMTVLDFGCGPGGFFRG